MKKNQGQGKVREFIVKSGKFEILAKVREKSGNSRIRSRGWRNQVIREIKRKLQSGSFFNQVNKQGYNL